MSDWRIMEGDAAEKLRELEDASIDAMVTDPPAGINFMGKTWDHDHGGRDGWVEAFAAIFRECLRVLKPGAHALVWALPRTSHWTATALEDAGFEIRDVVTHHFGSGFPKSLDVSKAIDRAAGAEREVIGPRVTGDGHIQNRVAGKNEFGTFEIAQDGIDVDTAPATEAAEEWEGWGTALKPASEHWVLCRKPLSEGNIAASVLKHGMGAINIDGCRIGNADGQGGGEKGSGGYHGVDGYQAGDGFRPSRQGRWPANLVLTHHPDCVQVGTKRVRQKSGSVSGDEPSPVTQDIYGDFEGRKPFQRYADPDGKETVAAYRCVDGCPIRILDEQSGESVSTGGRTVKRSGGGEVGSGKASEKWWTNDDPGFGDTGGASRFFYCAKPSRAERNIGLEGLPKKRGGSTEKGFTEDDCDRNRPTQNFHPTVKSVELMQWLCRLVTPPSGTILDLFAGSGTTGIAALREGFQFIGIEKEAEYVEMAKRRIEEDSPLFNRK